MALSKYTFKQNPGKTAYAYCRCSTDKQDTSIDQQIKMIKDYIAGHGYEIDEKHIYRDEGISGTEDDRPAYRAMLFDIDMLRPAVVVVWKLDRLSRDNAELTRVLNWLRQHGTQTISITEPATGNMMVDMFITGMAGVSAQWYVMQLAQNVRRGMNDRAEQGLYNGSPILGYLGKPKKPYMIDEDTAPIVQRIFREYLEGKPKQRIADDLNAAGLRYISGKPFALSSISRILSNRSYIGEYKWGAYTIPDAIPCLIDDDTFKQVQERIKLNSRGGTGARKRLHNEQAASFDLSAHTYCGYCGAPIHGKSGTSKTGAVYNYYVCGCYKQHKKCEFKPKRQELLEEIVNEIYEDFLHEPVNRLLVSSYCYAKNQEQTAGSSAYITSMEAERDACQKRRQNCIRAIEDGGYTPSMLDRIRELESQIQAQNEAIEAERLRQSNGPQFSTILRFFDSAVDKRGMKWELIDKVLVDNDKVVLIFKFLSDPREVSIDEMSRMLEDRKTIAELFAHPPEQTPEQRERFRVMLESMLGDDEETQGDQANF